MELIYIYDMNLSRQSLKCDSITVNLDCISGDVNGKPGDHSSFPEI